MSKANPRREAFEIGGKVVEAGKKAIVELPVARLYTGSSVAMSVVVLHGRLPGPRLWLDAAIHGDELNGIRIIRDVLSPIDPRKLAGTLLAVPVVNIFGLVNRSRYLPDRRDLNRSFPGSPRGSLASRLASLFFQTVVRGSDYGIDLHTAGPGRTNYPHLRINTRDPELRRLARAFGPPLVFDAPRIAGSLRAAIPAGGPKLLVYEAGEPRRFDRFAIQAGVEGVGRVLAELGMWQTPDLPPAPESAWGSSSNWIRASRSGVFNRRVELGDLVEEGQVIGSLSDPFPTRSRRMTAPCSGLVFGLAIDPLVHQGDALLHLVQAGPEPPLSDDVAAEDIASGEVEAATKAQVANPV